MFVVVMGLAVLESSAGAALQVAVAGLAVLESSAGAALQVAVAGLAVLESSAGAALQVAVAGLAVVESSAGAALQVAVVGLAVVESSAGAALQVAVVGLAVVAARLGLRCGGVGCGGTLAGAAPLKVSAAAASLCAFPAEYLKIRPDTFLRRSAASGVASRVAEDAHFHEPGATAPPAKTVDDC